MFLTVKQAIKDSTPWEDRARRGSPLKYSSASYSAWGGSWPVAVKVTGNRSGATTFAIPAHRSRPGLFRHRTFSPPTKSWLGLFRFRGCVRFLVQQRRDAFPYLGWNFGSLLRCLDLSLEDQLAAFVVRGEMQVRWADDNGRS